MRRPPFPPYLLLATLAGTLATAGCAESERLCYPGDYRACTCFDDSPGYQRCEDDGMEYGDCDCSGGLPQPAGDDDTTGGGGGYYY